MQYRVIFAVKFSLSAYVATRQGTLLLQTEKSGKIFFGDNAT